MKICICTYAAIAAIMVSAVVSAQGIADLDVNPDDIMLRKPNPAEQKAAAEKRAREEAAAKAAAEKAAAYTLQGITSGICFNDLHGNIVLLRQTKDHRRGITCFFEGRIHRVHPIAV